MDYSYYDKYVNKRTKGRYDVTPLFQHPDVFSHLVDDLVLPFKNERIDKIVGLDALGFIIGGAVAQKMHIGFVPVRKGGKLPGIRGTVLRTTFVDYTHTKKSFEMNKTAIRKGDRVLIVDEWIETGAQVKSAIKLIEKQGGVVVGISALCAEKTKNTQPLFENYTCTAIRIVEK